MPSAELNGVELEESEPTEILVKAVHSLQTCTQKKGHGKTIEISGGVSSVVGVWPTFLTTLST